jgi:hypothetical protein
LGNGERSTLKKLKGAARSWLGVDKPPAAKPITVDDDVAEGMRAMGASEACIEAEQKANAAAAPPVDMDFEVYEDCWESVMFFLAVQTQWVWVGGGMERPRREGLSYPGVESAARLGGVRRSLWPALFADLRVIELEVLAAQGDAVG